MYFICAISSAAPHVTCEKSKSFNIGPDKQNFWAENCDYFSYHHCKHVFWVLKKRLI